jgi:hypothetical protein
MYRVSYRGGAANFSGGDGVIWVRGVSSLHSSNKDVRMKRTVSIEVPADQETLFRRFLALNEELQQLALTAPDGTVFDSCEAAILEKGRDLQTQVLTDAVARRIEAAEKKGRRSAFALAAGRKKTVDPKPASS